MQSEDYYIRLERKIIIGMILSDDFLKIAYDLIIPKNMLGEAEAKTLVNWIRDYYQKREAAPKKEIQNIFEKQLSSKRISEAIADNIEDILDSLSHEAEELDPVEIEDLKDQLSDYVNYCKTKLTIEQAEDLLEAGDIQEAKELLHDYEPIEILEPTSEKIFENDEKIEEVFKESEEPLFKYKGRYGKLINPYLVRGGFPLFLAINKGGKSFHLMDAAIKAASQKKRVILYQAGDMTHNQMKMRMAINATGISNKKEYCGPLYIPVVDCVHNLRDECYEDCRIEPEQEGPLSDKGTRWFSDEINFNEMKMAFQENPEHVPCTECRKRGKFNKFKPTIWFTERKPIDPLTPAIFKRIWRKNKGKFSSPFNALNSDYLYMSTFSNDSLTISKVRNEVILLRKQGWEPEMIVLDYMDILQPDYDSLKYSIREQENIKYKRARKLTQDFNLLLLSASQSDAPGFTKRFLDRSNFSEDRRKLDHITGLIGLNMTNEEKKLGMCRVNEIISRETEGTKIVTILHRLQTGRPVIDSF